MASGDSNHEVKYVDFSSDPFIARKVKIHGGGLTAFCIRLDLTIRVLTVIDSTISQIQLRCS